MTPRRALLAAPALLAVPARAQPAWPAERPIEVVVPFPPGGGVDIMTRAVLPFVQAQLPGARFVVNNRGGAGGQVGNEATANAAPDGYSIGAVSLPGFIAIPIERQVRYRPSEMTLIANVVDDPCALFVRADSPWRTLADMVAAARARPDTVTYGTTGIGSDDHIMMVGFEALTGTRFSHVPFTGMSQMFPQLLGGNIDLGAMNVSEALPLVREGRIRGLGQAGAERWSQMTGVPTFREQGHDVVASASRGFAGPGGLPAPIVQRLEAAFAAALTSPEFAREAERLALPLKPLTGAAYRRFVLDQETALRRLWETRPWRERG
ncbi:MAG: tripartite tricarboxylate transporter substrate binding protein [Acetobacteraceae bacterium]|nr:tripartite tricarboxylate transporter substrate binding protein [Acetobacteraceae bacterium]